MVCDKCYEKIKKGEEIRIENSQFLCRSCAKDPIDHCYTCFGKIYRNQKTYKLPSKKQSRSFSFFKFFSFSDKSSSSEQANQCVNCYLNWRLEEERWQKISKIGIFNVIFWIIIFIAHWILHILLSHETNFDQPRWFTKMVLNHPKWCNISHLIAFAYLVLFYVFIYLKYYPNRHKLRLK